MSRRPHWESLRGAPESVSGPLLTFFSLRFREGISFPNFVERCIPELPLSKLCPVPFAVQNRALFEGGGKGEKVPRKGEEEGWPAKGAKRKKGRVKTGQSKGHLREGVSETPNC